MMNPVLQAFVIAVLVAFLQSGENQQRYDYYVIGNVLDEHEKEMADITVCFIPAERPINGRIPCNKTNAAGAFSIGVRDVPDKYKVCASTTDSPFVTVGDDDPKHRVACSDVLQFPPKDETVNVSIRFKSK